MSSSLIESGNSPMVPSGSSISSPLFKLPVAGLYLRQVGCGVVRREWSAPWRDAHECVQLQCAGPCNFLHCLCVLSPAAGKQGLRRANSAAVTAAPES